MIQPDDGAFRTQDMALATVLVSQGHSYSLERLSRTSAAWVFTATPEREEEMDDLLDRYDSGNCRVDPREFAKELSKVRDELLSWLYGPKQRNAPSGAGGKRRRR